MKIVLLGPPGAGKGTQAASLSLTLRIPHISTGDIVRDEIKAQTKLGNAIKSYSDKGILVPDKIIVRLLKKRIKNPDCQKGFILDGFPRTIQQAESLDKISNIDLVVNLNVPDEIIIQRLSNRLICGKCGAIYNRIVIKPKRGNICDKCGNELYQREDDNLEVIQERLKVYREKTEPVIDYYKRRKLLNDVYCDNLMTPPDVILRRILELLGSIKKS